MASFHLYGFFIGLGIVVGILVVRMVNRQWSIVNGPRQLAGRQSSIMDILPWLLVPGLVGARLYHVIDYWQYYSKNPIEIFYLWQGGMGIYGAIVGGLLGLWGFSIVTYYKRTTRRNFRKLFNCSIVQLFNFADLAAFGLPVGQAIGRLGNYFNQELYGLPTNLPWGIYIGPENRLPGYEGFSYFHPLFAYEAIWNLAIFIILIKIASSRFKVPSFGSGNSTIASAVPACRQAGSKPDPSAGRQGLRRYKPGTFFFIYLGLYGFGRFWLEFLRINPWEVGGINVAQVISVGLIVIGLIGLIRRI